MAAEDERSLAKLTSPGLTENAHHRLLRSMTQVRDFMENGGQVHDCRGESAFQCKSGIAPLHWPQGIGVYHARIPAQYTVSRMLDFYWTLLQYPL